MPIVTRELLKSVEDLLPDGPVKDAVRVELEREAASVAFMIASMKESKDRRDVNDHQ